MSVIRALYRKAVRDQLYRRLTHLSPEAREAVIDEYVDNMLAPTPQPEKSLIMDEDSE